MKSYVLRRLGYMVLTLVLVSIFSFIVIQLPPGDYVSAYISRIQSEMGTVDPEMVEGLRKAYGLDKSMMEQYFYWMGNIFRGDFGTSFEWKRPVLELILDRLPITLLLSHKQGGHQQINARIAYNEIDLVLLFTDPNTTDPWDDAQMIETIRHCDRHNVPIATNLASAEMLIMGLQRGDLDWREMLHNKTRY